MRMPIAHAIKWWARWEAARRRLVPGDNGRQGDAENVDWILSRLRHRDARHGHSKHQRVEREMHGLGQRPFVARDRNQQRRRNCHHAAKSKHGRCEDVTPACF
jgi:hypothetical protein